MTPSQFTNALRDAANSLDAHLATLPALTETIDPSIVQTENGLKISAAFVGPGDARLDWVHGAVAR